MNQSHTRFTKRIFKLMTMTQPVFFMLMNLAGLAIYWLAAILIDEGSLPLGQLVAFNDYLFHAMFSVMLFCTVFYAVSQSGGICPTHTGCPGYERVYREFGRRRENRRYQQYRF